MDTPRTEASGVLRIGALAAELGLNPKTIRFYEQIGLLPEPARSVTDYPYTGPPTGSGCIS